MFDPNSILFDHSSSLDEKEAGSNKVSSDPAAPGRNSSALIEPQYPGNSSGSPGEAPGSGRLMFPEAREQATCRITEIPLACITLMSGLSLETYLSLVGKNYDVLKTDSSPVLLQTDASSYCLINPFDGAVRITKSRNGDVLRAAVYKVRKRFVKEVLSRVELCLDPGANVIDVAESYRFLTAEVGLRQKDLFAWFGCSQPNISNKIRLCRLSAPVKRKMRSADLTEKHGRALLNTDTEEMRRYLADLFAGYKISASRAEQLGRVLKNQKVAEIGKDAYIALINDSLSDVSAALDREKEDRLNTLKRDINDIRRSGIPLLVKNTETNDYVELTVRIPKNTAYMLQSALPLPAAAEEGSGDSSSAAPGRIIKFPDPETVGRMLSEDKVEAPVSAG